MINGVFYLTFESSLGVLGAGLAVLEDGQIRGGDDSYLYSGWYKSENEDSTFIAEVGIQHYQGDQGSIFGFLDSFQLELVGSSTKGGLRASGSIKAQPAFKISLEGVRIEDIHSSIFSGLPNRASKLSRKDQFTLEDPFNLLNEPNRNSFATAAQLHSLGKYLDALKIMFPIIEAAFNALLRKVGETPERFSGLTKKAEALGSQNIIPNHIVHATDIVYARNKILHGSYCPPDNYLYPISLLCFQHLHSLLTECNPSP